MKGSIRIEVVGPKAPLARPGRAGVGSDVVDELALDVDGQLAALVEGLDHAVVGGVARRVDRAADAYVVADLELDDVIVRERRREAHFEVVDAFDGHAVIPLAIAVRQVDVDDDILLRAARHDHVDRRCVAGVDLLVHEVRRHEDEVARLRLDRVLQVVAEAEAGVTADDVDHALELAVVVRPGADALVDADVADPEVLGAHRLRAHSPPRGTCPASAPSTCRAGRA